MKVYVFGNGKQSEELYKKITSVLEELGLSDFVELEITQDESLKKELSIKEESACIIEEESINFKDMIFEGILPEEEELKSMFISIIGWGTGGGCGSKDDSGWCGTWCSC